MLFLKFLSTKTLGNIKSGICCDLESWKHDKSLSQNYIHIQMFERVERTVVSGIVIPSMKPLVGEIPGLKSTLFYI